MQSDIRPQRGRDAIAERSAIGPETGDLWRGLVALALPQAFKWQVARADEDYDAALFEASRITVDTTRITSESFPMAVPPEEAERRCRRALMEAWTGRETAAFRLPPSRLALYPADVVALEHDGRHIPLRLVSIADAEARGIEAVRQDRESMMPGVRVADVARKHGTTRWQVYDWRKKIRKGDLVVPESVAALPMFAELVVDHTATAAPLAVTRSELEIVVGDVVIRVGADADEGQLTRAIRAARAAAS